MDIRNKSSMLITAHLFILLIGISNLHGETSMQAIYSLNKSLMPKLEPIKYSTKNDELGGLFDFPMDNTIATNMLPGTNAVNRVEFDGKKIKYKTVAKNFKDYVGGGSTTYTPIFSEDWIGYAQTRGFTLLNVKTKECHYYSIIGNTNYLIRNIIVINPNKKIFLFVIGVIASDKPLQVLMLMDLSTPAGKMINEKMMSSKIGISNINETLFFTENNRVKAYNLNFEEIDHPLVTAFNNEYKIQNKIKELVVHPFHPFAVFGSQDSNTLLTEMYLIRWDTIGDAEKPKLFKLLPSGVSYEFSYDGKWLISKGNVQNKFSYLLLPVEKTLPQYLGKPIYLGEMADYPSGTGTSAMTRNPSGLVVTECEGYKLNCRLKKWDFTEAEKLIEKE